jgi:hypothetical protein
MGEVRGGKFGKSSGGGCEGIAGGIENEVVSKADQITFSDSLKRHFELKKYISCPPLQRGGMGVSQIYNAGFSRLFQGLKPPKSFMFPVHPRLKPGATDRSNPNQSNKISCP